MGRPRKANPKTRHIGIVTTPEKYNRFKALGLVGDEAIDALLYHMEKDKTKLSIQKMQIIGNIKKIAEEIEHLEYEKLKLETKLEEINQSIGINEANGLRKDINNAICNVLNRYDRVKEIYNIYDFMDFNKEYIETQAFLVNIPPDELRALIIENI